MNEENLKPDESSSLKGATIGFGTSNTVLPPLTIRMSNPDTGELLGEFKEKDGVLTFEGKVDDAGKVFVDFVCGISQQIEQAMEMDCGCRPNTDIYLETITRCSKCKKEVKTVRMM